MAVAVMLVALPLHAQVVLNEYSCANLSHTADNYGKYEDWLELFNTGSAPVDLANWKLSDNPQKPDKWAFPTGSTIAPGGFLKVWLSGRDEVANGNYHANFKLTQTKKEPETLILMKPNGDIVDNREVKKTRLGHSVGRKDNGSDEWGICPTPTPGLSNNPVSWYNGYAKKPDFSQSAGFYQDSVVVEITSEDTAVVIRYTLNGDQPTAQSLEYTGPITITETTVLKAVAFSTQQGVLASFLEFATYFVNEDFSLPVVSASGTQLLELANGNQDLRPKGSFEMFSTDKERVASVTGELNSHGQDSWVNDQRSIDWVSRDEMGEDNAIEELLFPGLSERDEFQRVILRAAGDDNYPGGSGYPDGGAPLSAHVRDAYIHNLALQGDMQLDVRTGSKCIVFFNGAYWGVYDFRELPDDHDYTEFAHGQGKYDLEYLLTWGNTWAQYDADGEAFGNWDNLYEFVENNDLADSANYAYVESQLDVASLADYFIVNSFCVASDWINWNTGWWRGLNPDGSHQKWGYILWDLDATFAYYINYTGIPDTSATALPCNPELIDLNDWWDPYPQQHINLLKKLRTSPVFNQFYVTRQADMLKTVFSCENMLAYLDEVVASIAPEMPKHIDRWGGSMAEWETNVRTLQHFIERRCAALTEGMHTCYETTGPYDVVLKVEPAGTGAIQANTLVYNQLPTQTPFFGNIDLKLEGLANTGFMFDHWESTNHVFTDSSLASNALFLTQPDTVTAYFKEMLPAGTNDPRSATFEVAAQPTLFHQAFTMQYTIHERAKVAVRLLDVAGREVAVLANGMLPSPAGSHQIGFDAGQKGIAAGVYFLQVTVDNDLQKTLKLVKGE